MSEEDQDNDETPEPIDRRDRSPEAVARHDARRRDWREKHPVTGVSGFYDRLTVLACKKNRTPFEQSRYRELLTYERAHRRGDQLTVRWESSHGEKQRVFTHHPWCGWTAFVAEGTAPLPLTATLADLAVAVRNDQLEQWALAAAPDPEAPADAADRVLQRLWAAETRPFHLARCLVSRGNAVCVAFVRAMRARVLRERFPCYECGDLHDNLMGYKYDRTRSLWPENDVSCVDCADALRAAVVDMRLRWLAPITPKRREWFARQTWEGAKRANRVY